MGAVYSNTLARINTGRLLTREQYKRLSESDYSSALKILAEYGYGGGVAGDDVDAVIGRETDALIAFIEEDCVNRYARKVLLNRFYYNNAKAYYKSRFSPVDLKSAIYRTELDLSGIRGGDYVDCDRNMTDALETLDGFDGAPHPKTIDTTLTKAMYRDSLFNAHKSHSGVLKKYVVAEIDLRNILSALRGKALGLDAAAVEEQLLSGGTIDFETLTGLLTVDMTQLGSALSGTPYDAIVERFVEKGFAYLAEAEAGADDYLYMLTDSGAVSLDKFDVFLRYVLAQLNEFKMVKMILVCLKVGAQKEISARMRCLDE